jgi:ABC-type lipoprotein export system ATPase subunit
VTTEAAGTRVNGLLIDARMVTIQKGDNVLLQSAALSLGKATFAALVGPSGCGKTSLLRVLALLDKPSMGTVSLWGKETIDAQENGFGGFYPRVTYVPQTLALWPHLTIRENVLFAAQPSPKTQSNLDALCLQLEVAHLLERKPFQLSQGQQQRSALVRAMLLDPEILLLDEITAALDEDLADRVWTLLRAFVTNGGGILASTHDQRLSSLCDCSFRIRERTLQKEEIKKG